MFNDFFDGFISYGRADSKAFAAKLQGDLGEAGFNMWFDQNDIPLGVDFQNQIDDGIEKAHNFLYVIAPHSVNSPYCLKEVVLALKCNKPIIPLLHVEEISVETWKERNPGGTEQQWEEYQSLGKHSSFPNMHPTIGKINWIYFREGIDDYEQSLKGLIGLMHKQEDYVHQHTRFLAQALEWDRNHRQTRLLLTGDERKEAKQWLVFRYKDEQPPCEPTDLQSEYICESEKNANNQLTDVFLSYSEHDEDVMNVIARKLMREGKTIWRNTTDIRTGTEFQAEINQGIERADNVIFLLSQDSLDSIYCQQELEYATALNKRLITLMVCPTEIETIPAQWRSLQFIDIANTDNPEKYEQGLTRMIKVLQEDSVYHYQHKAILVQALKWKAQNENASILYRGYNLKNAQGWLTLAKKHPRYPALPLHGEFLEKSAAQPPDLSLDVFLSYSRADGDFARKINEALQIQGKTAWFDQESIASGADFQEEIHRGIEQCDNFLFIVSPDAVESDYCLDEVEFAAKLNKRFVTLLHRPIAEEKMHPAFANIQWIDFKRHSGDFNANFSDLIRTLNLDRDHVKSHTKWLQRSLEWGEKDKPKDMLLRGNEFSIAKQWLDESETQAKKPPATDLQREFITKSQGAIEAELRREKQRQTILKALLGLVSIVAVIAVMAVGVALRKNKELQISEIRAITTTTKALFALNDQIDALTNSIEAGVKLTGLGEKVDPAVRREVEETLGQTIYGARAMNRLSGHQAPVLSVAYSPSGNYIASASADNSVKLWDKAGKELVVLPGHNDSVLAIAFSPDEKFVATGGVDQSIKIWDLNGQLITSLIGHLDQVNSLEFNSDGTMLLSGSGDKTAKLWDLRSGKRLVTYSGHSDKINNAKFSPTSNKIATASQDLTIKLWDLDGDILQTLEGHTDKVTALDFAPDGKTLASVSNDQSLKTWDVATGNFLQEISGSVNTNSHTAPINDVKFSSNGGFLVTASDDNTVKLWSPEGYLITTLRGHTDRVTHVDISPDRENIISSSLDNSILIWRWRGNPLIKPLFQSQTVTGLVFGGKANHLYSVDEDGLLKQWDLNRADSRLYSYQHRKAIEQKTKQPRTTPLQLSALAVSPDEELILTGDRQGNIYFWNKGGDLLKTHDAHYDDVLAIAFSPDAQTFATAGRDKHANIWHRDGRFITRIHHSDALTSIAFSPDGQFIATGSWDNSVKIWNRQGRLMHTFTGHKGSVVSIAISPDSRTVASGSGDNTIKIWDVDTKELMTTLTGHSDSVYALAFSPDGRTLASGSGDRRIKLWDVATNTLKTTYSGHQGDVVALTFSPDSKSLASGSEDNTAIIWNVNSVLDLPSLLAEACEWNKDFLENNAKLTSEERDICDGVVKPIVKVDKIDAADDDTQ
ncbi:MAG: TIR domain-containing protein [Limnothrix sp. RL_2_0]|nr:TIR domain-containing protein [Limnothrix sp. RL_2_0]